MGLLSSTYYPSFLMRLLWDSLLTIICRRSTQICLASAWLNPLHPSPFRSSAKIAYNLVANKPRSYNYDLEHGEDNGDGTLSARMTHVSRQTYRYLPRDIMWWGASANVFAAVLLMFVWRVWRTHTHSLSTFFSPPTWPLLLKYCRHPKKQINESCKSNAQNSVTTLWISKSLSWI